VNSEPFSELIEISQRQWILIREVWLKNRAVRVSGSNPKAARGCLKKQEPRLRKN
jgi:hypothetical protein